MRYASPRFVEWGPAWVGAPGHRLMVVLTAPGCAWATDGPGCISCAFPQTMGTGGEPVSSAAYAAQLEEALDHLPEPEDRSGPVAVELFVSGSWLNPGEVPPDAQVALVRRAASVPGVARVLVETRPEYAAAAALRACVEAAGGAVLEVGIGLETADDALRDAGVRKGYSRADLRDAAVRVRDAGAHLLVYVLLKPLGLTDAEAVEDAVATCTWVFDLGAALGLPVRIALEPVFVAADTELELAWRDGQYSPPPLSAAAEVVRRVAHRGAVHVGLSDEGLDAARGATGPEREALGRFNLTQDLGVLG